MANEEKNLSKTLLDAGTSAFATGAAKILDEFKPLHNVCEFLHAFHIYADEARRGEIRAVEASHYCSHVRHDLRQCLIYDSATKGAKLIGVEYMVPKHVFETLDPEEQKLWHSHEFEVKSGMLILPKPTGIPRSTWEDMELEAMKEVIGWYGKTWHTWQVDRYPDIPLGMPVLMGSLTKQSQVSIEKALDERDALFGINRKDKAAKRACIPSPEIHKNADSWFSGIES